MSKPFKILIADDDAALILPFLTVKLPQQDNIVLDTAETPEACLQSLQRETPNLLFLDIDFGCGEQDGLTLIPMIRSAHPDLRIVMLSSQDDEATLLKALTLGATDFLSKRLDRLDGLPTYVSNIVQAECANEQMGREAQQIAKLVGAEYQSASMHEVFLKVLTARKNPQLPVLITGETGVGKELVARAINASLNRVRVDVDCGAIADNLIESEFFGHTKGAFTGADSAREGKFVQADGGDLFLDEIGNLRRAAQDRFLRVLQMKEVTPIGSKASISVNVRVIAATNENLEAMVEQGTFRGDLLERLKGVWIEIPPLRHRLEDLESIIQAAIAKHGRSDVQVSPTCLAVLKTYEWPGNVRELESVVREMLTQVTGNLLNIMHLPERIRKKLTTGVKRLDAPKTATNATHSLPPHSFASIENQYQLPLTGEWDHVVDALMQRYLPERFKRLGAGANRTELARSLGLARNTLATHLKRLNIKLGDEISSPIDSQTNFPNEV